MNERQHKIGYNRTVKLQWLDETLDLYLGGRSDAEIYEILSERLKNELPWEVKLNAEVERRQ